MTARVSKTPWAAVVWTVRPRLAKSRFSGIAWQV